MSLKVLGPIRAVVTIAAGSAIRDVARLRRWYGRGRWRKRKGLATVQLPDGTVVAAEVHWYEAAGIGKRELRIKHIID